MPEQPERLACVDPKGTHLFWTDADIARELIRDHQVRLIHKRGRARILVALVAEPSLKTGRDGKRISLAPGPEGRGSGMDKTRYSHNYETETNPVNVWELRRLPNSTRPIFRAVIESVAA